MMNIHRRMNRCLRLSLTIVFACGLMASHAAAQQFPPDTTAITAKVGQKPFPPAYAYWLGLIGEYGHDDSVVIVLERTGRLFLLHNREEVPLRDVSHNVYEVVSGPRTGQRAVFTRNAVGRGTTLQFDGASYARRKIEPETGNQLHVKPLRPVRDLMKEALAAQPPKEDGEFLPTDLVELRKLDPSIHLEIRYATTNNFLGTVFYSQPRAFMQRPAAEALVRASMKLHQFGYGLLVHDAYRPWHVTKVFWDATPDDKKIFVADPAKGSRHNRGCAVDVTLYDLNTGKPIQMVSTYDETTARAYPDYPGGTSLQRWHRALLRAAIEGEGFTVYEAEWWHFDYKDWRKYRIGNVTFEQIK
jgi:D-alanyl-D-alanine dipeptidase